MIHSLCYDLLNIEGCGCWVLHVVFAGFVSHFHIFVSGVRCSEVFRGGRTALSGAGKTSGENPRWVVRFSVKKAVEFGAAEAVFTRRSALWDQLFGLYPSPYRRHADPKMSAGSGGIYPGFEVWLLS